MKRTLKVYKKGMRTQKENSLKKYSKYAPSGINSYLKVTKKGTKTGLKVYKKGMDYLIGI